MRADSCRRSNEQPDKALAAYDQALKQSNALFGLERYEQAIASYDQVIKIAPKSEWAWFNKAMALWNLERYKDAIASPDESLRINPNNQEAKQAKQELLQLVATR